MSDNEMQFRTAAFGGFQKQDVLNYLEQSTKEHAAKVSALQRQLDEAERARDKAQADAAAGEARCAKLEEESGRLSADLADREAKLATAEAGRAELSAQVADLAARIQALEPAAEAYEALKDRTAGIELEAHSRAREIEAEAQAKAQKTRTDVEMWFCRLQSTYCRLRADLNAAVSHSGEELGRIEKSLADMAGGFSVQDAQLEELRKNVEGLAGPKAPEPLPLDQ